MPQNNKNSTLLRQWEMMRMLTVSRSLSKHDGRWDKASEITARLITAGYNVSVRTVQRDLKELSDIFPIELNDKNPRDYGWRWIKGANLDIPGMTVPEALAMCLVETHMKQLLPISMLEGLQGLFTLAQSKLEKVEKAEDANSSYSKNWLGKVRVVPPVQPLLPPVVKKGVQAAIYEAVLENRQLTASYQPMGREQPKDYVLHPLGLIMRGALTYLVASARNYADVRLYALHRFSKAEVLDAAAIVPKGFNLDTAIANGLADFANQGAPSELELRCTEKVAAYLVETPLAADQKLEPQANGWVRMTATVNDTWQLHWWLLGQGDGVEVINPPELRNQLKIIINSMKYIYFKKHSNVEPG